MPKRPDLAVKRSSRLGLLMGLTVALVAALLVLVAMGYLALARVIAGQAIWAVIVVASAYLLFKFADDLWMTCCPRAAASASGCTRGWAWRRGYWTKPPYCCRASAGS
jgi:small-conductance mechanosensitive channel